MEFITYTLDHYANPIVALFLAAVIWLYFRSNPLRHSSWFTVRRFINWFPLGMTYSFLYMGRYNLNVRPLGPERTFVLCHASTN